MLVKQNLLTHLCAKLFPGLDQLPGNQCSPFLVPIFPTMTFPLKIAISKATGELCINMTKQRVRAQGFHCVNQVVTNYHVAYFQPFPKANVPLSSVAQFQEGLVHALQRNLISQAFFSSMLCCLLCF